MTKRQVVKLTEDAFGKPYQTRSGRKAWLLSVGTGIFEFRGVIEDGGSFRSRHWNPEGLVYTQGRGCKEPDDIISEWREPRSGECWVNVYQDEEGRIYTVACVDKAAAKDSARLRGPSYRLNARIRVPWTEGQFDE